MEITITQTEDKYFIEQALITVGSETHNLEQNEISWIAYRGSKICGIVGVRHLKSDYAIVDIGPAALPSLSPHEQFKVISALMKMAESMIQTYTKHIYTHNAEEMIDFLITAAGYIKTTNVPMSYSHPCMVCQKRNVTCFPALLTKVLV